MHNWVQWFAGLTMARKTALVFLVSYLAVWGQFALTQTPPAPAADALGYVSLANNLTHRGVLSAIPEGNQPTPFYAPLYPLFLSAIAHVDSGMAEALRCFGAAAYRPGSATCTAAFQSVYYVHLVFAALTLTIIWFAGLLIFRSSMLGILAAVSCFATGRLALFSGLLLTENLFIPFMAAASLFFTLSVRERRWHDFLCCGIALGLAALTRPTGHYAFLAIVCFLIVYGLYVFARRRAKSLILGSGIVCIAYLAAVSPWLLRNSSEFGSPFLTRGYASFILVERVAYNRMTGRDLSVSLVYWLPWPGQQLAESWFDSSILEKLSFEGLESLYVQGNIEKQTLREQMQNEEDRFSYLLIERVFGDFFKHATVTVALAYRGIWIVKYWTLLAVPVLFYLIWRAMRHRRDVDYLTFMGPALFMLFFHAFVSVNIHRYNLILLPSLSLAMAWLAMRVFTLSFVRRRIPAAWSNLLSIPAD